jgi:hypothetical protein
VGSGTAGIDIFLRDSMGDPQVFVVIDVSCDLRRFWLPQYKTFQYKSRDQQRIEMIPLITG